MSKGLKKFTAFRQKGHFSITLGVILSCTAVQCREAAAAKASEWLNAARLETTDMLRELQRKVAGTAAASPTGELNAARLNAARLETTDMLRQLQREVAGTAGAEEAEQREVTVRRRQQEYTVTQQQGFTSAKVW